MTSLKFLCLHLRLCPKSPAPPVTRGDGGVRRPPRKDSGRAPRAKGVNKAPTLWYTNCRSLKNKLQDFHATASLLPDNAILLLTETWLDSSVHDGELLGTPHGIFRRDRE